MILNLFTFLIIPGYTLLFVRNFNLFSLNFSVIGNMLGKRGGFCIWGLLTGAYFYWILSRISKQLSLSRRARFLIGTALLLLFCAVTTPYLPDELPFKAFLHIVFAMAASVCLFFFLFFASWRLFSLDRCAGLTALWSLGGILVLSAFLLSAVGIISSALEIFFTFSTVFLSRFLLWRGELIEEKKQNKNEEIFQLQESH